MFSEMYQTTKLILTQIKTKTDAEVSVFLNNNGREPTTHIIEELVVMWPDCTILFMVVHDVLKGKAT